MFHMWGDCARLDGVCDLPLRKLPEIIKILIMFVANVYHILLYS